MPKCITADLEISPIEENYSEKKSDEESSYEEQTKHHDNVFFEGAISGNVFLREKFLSIFFEGAIWRISLLGVRETINIKR